MSVVTTSEVSGGERKASGGTPKKGLKGGAMGEKKGR